MARSGSFCRKRGNGQITATPTPAVVETGTDSRSGAEDAPLGETPSEEPGDAPEGLLILDAADVALDDFLWVMRIVAVVADTPNDPSFVQQMRDIEARSAELFERDVVVVIDSDRNSGSDLRRRLRPRGFMLAIIGKDGEIKQRRPAPRDVREISAIIDRFPLRRQEILERLPTGR
jgi:hypothetical protein